MVYTRASLFVAVFLLFLMYLPLFARLSGVFLIIYWSLIPLLALYAVSRWWRGWREGS